MISELVQRARDGRVVRPAFASYDDEVRPGELCDVLVRAEDPQRPAVLVRR